ncbi:uncharacterized protein LOC142345406 isoform X2 [Convolutriloba macropyga]
MQQSSCSCGETECDLFYCLSCLQEGDSEKELLCPICVGGHIKKSHNVKTIKDHTPVICNTHKILKTEYCKSCDTTICCNCRKNHRNHEIGDLEVRAKELKTEVFELLSELDLKEKPLQRRKEHLNDASTTNNEKQHNLKETILREIEALKTACLEKIEENLRTLNEEKENCSKAIEEILKLQTGSRNLLSLNNAALVEQFHVTKKAYSEQKENIENQTNKGEVNVKSCEIEAVQNQIEAFKESLTSMIQNETRLEPENVENELTVSLESGKKLQPPKLEARSVVTLVYFCENFKLTVGNGELRIDKLQVEFPLVTYKQVSTHNFDCEIMRTFKLMSDVLIILTNNGKLFQLGERHSSLNSNSKLIEFELPKFENLLFPYNVGMAGSDWCYWDATKSKIKYSHDDDVEVACDVFPKLLTSSAEFAVFELGSSALLFVYPLEQLYGRRIMRFVVPRRSINHVEVIAWNANFILLLVWSIQERRAVEVILKPGQDKVGKKFTWREKDASKPFGVTLSNNSLRTLLPA